MDAISALIATGSLYASVDVDIETITTFGQMLALRQVRFDAYCPSCRQPTTWAQVAEPAQSTDFTQSHGIDHSRFLLLNTVLRSLEFQCSRNLSHRFFAHLSATPSWTQRPMPLGAGTRTVLGAAKLIKHGQLPSVADISSSEVNEIRRYASKADIAELTRAIGLAAHGIGIGSFVYLRRIFERLVDNAAAEARKHGEPLDGFERLRMAEKVKALVGHVPSWMIENKSLYSILSKGVHELNEETCLAAFAPLKEATLALLERNAAEQRNAARATAAAEALAKLGDALSKD